MLWRYQERIIKKRVKDTNKLKFSEKLWRVNYIMNTNTETINKVVNLNEAFKEDIVNEIKPIVDMEDYYLLEASLLGNKLFYGSKT